MLVARNGRAHLQAYPQFVGRYGAVRYSDESSEQGGGRAVLPSVVATAPVRWPFWAVRHSENSEQG